MPRAMEYMVVTAPERPGEGPVVVEVSALAFKTGRAPEDRSLELTAEEVGDLELSAGIVVGALCHIFIERPDELRPEELFVAGVAEAS